MEVADEGEYVCGQGYVWEPWQVSAESIIFNLCTFGFTYYSSGDKRKGS